MKPSRDEPRTRSYHPGRGGATLKFMDDTQLRRALETVQGLAEKHRAAAEQLDQAATALTELVESAEFSENRREAIEAARPFLSEEALKRMLPGAVAPAPRRKARGGSPWFKRSEEGGSSEPGW